MKKIFLTTAMTIVALISVKVNAQQTITVQNGSIVSFHNNIDSAVNQAQNGDTLYLPGGVFNFSQPISKRLHIIGVGHNPDSTVSTNQTFVPSITLVKGADGGLLSGIYMQGDIIFGTSQTNANVINFSIRRCKIINIYSSSNTSSNNIYVENIIRSVDLPNSQSNTFFNNILEFYVSLGSNNLIKNNLFLYSGGNIGNTLTNSSLENNIFIATNLSIPFNYSNNTYNNNIFVENLSFPYGTNIGVNNIVNQPQSSIFVNQSGYSFGYSQNYRLKSSSPGINAGTDAKDIGIYGGFFPWKDGSLPNNPHIQSKSISGSTDQNGNLQINIKVKAQNN